MSSPTSLLTLGYGQTVLLFLFEASVKEGYKPNVVKNLDAGENLSFMVKHPRLQNVFYAAHEMESGGVSRWNLNAQGQFNMLEKVTFSGKHPCHLSINDDENALYIANYGGSFTTFNLDTETGKLLSAQTKPFAAGSNAVPDRQKEAHPHAVYSWREFVYVVDLGADKIYRYTHSKDNNGSIEKLGETNLPLGWGPRHMAIINDVAYVIFELKNRVAVYKMNPNNGELIEAESVPTIEDSDIQSGEPEYGAEIEAHPNGKWLYVSNRGTGPMLLYHIDQESKLLTSKPNLTPKVKGVWPRHFTISKDGKQLFVVEQKLNKLQIWNISSEDGSLSLHQEMPSENQPAVVVEI